MQVDQEHTPCLKADREDGTSALRGPEFRAYESCWRASARTQPLEWRTALRTAASAAVILGSLSILGPLGLLFAHLKGNQVCWWDLHPCPRGFRPRRGVVVRFQAPCADLVSSLASPAPGVGLGTALLHSQVAGHRIEMRGVYLGAHEQA
jgi:hypothetical protein